MAPGVAGRSDLLGCEEGGLGEQCSWALKPGDITLHPLQPMALPVLSNSARWELGGHGGGTGLGCKSQRNTKTSGQEKEYSNTASGIQLSTRGLQAGIASVTRSEQTQLSCHCVSCLCPSSFARSTPPGTELGWECISQKTLC